jgi:putative SOS response-associated peptidase YedK
MFMRHLHDRMPVILTKEPMDVWLDRSTTDTDTVMSVLKPYEGEMYAYRVPELVGNVRNDTPECIEAIR